MSIHSLLCFWTCVWNITRNGGYVEKLQRCPLGNLWGINMWDVTMWAKGIILLVLYIFGRMIVLSDGYGQFRSFCCNGTAACCYTGLLIGLLLAQSTNFCKEAWMNNRMFSSMWPDGSFKTWGTWGSAKKIWGTFHVDTPYQVQMMWVSQGSLAAAFGPSRSQSLGAPGSQGLSRWL